MAILACLGRENYWMTIPFACVMSAFMLFGVIWPNKLPTPPNQRRWSPTAIRLFFGVMLVVTLGFAVPSMFREAHNDPACNHPGSLVHHADQGSDPR